MEKAELVGLTLDKLIDHFRLSPESFEYSEGICPTVVWQPKVQIGDLTTDPLYDPNNTHAIIVQYNPNYCDITCYLFLNAPTIPLNNTNKADSTINSRRWFEKYRNNYRKLMKLRELIKARDSHKANLIYLRKLSSVFPDAMDDHIK